MTKIKLTLLPVLAILFILGACSKPTPMNKAEVANSFVQAMNQNDTSKVVSLSAEPLAIRNQEWVSAPDGYGFVLGKAQDTSLSDKSRIKSYFSGNIEKIGVEGKAPISATLTLINDQLAGVEGNWQGLDIFLFIRGMGDVEHIFVLGINSKGKVTAIYLN